MNTPTVYRFEEKKQLTLKKPQQTSIDGFLYWRYICAMKTESIIKLNNRWWRLSM